MLETPRPGITCLTDVEITSPPGNNNVLIYDADAGKWKPGEDSDNLYSLNDVDVTGMTDGQILTLNVAAGYKFTPADKPPVINSLSNIADVSTATAFANNVLENVTMQVLKIKIKKIIANKIGVSLGFEL